MSGLHALDLIVLGCILLWIILALLYMGKRKKGERDVAAATAATHAQVVKMRKKSRKSKKNGTTDCAFGKTGVEYVN